MLDCNEFQGTDIDFKMWSPTFDSWIRNTIPICVSSANSAHQEEDLDIWKRLYLFLEIHYHRTLAKKFNYITAIMISYMNAQRERY